MSYDRQGQPITRDEYEQLMSSCGENKRVARTEVGKTVSTAWLGIDHSGGEGPPLIFETMVFAGHLTSKSATRRRPRRSATRQWWLESGKRNRNDRRELPRTLRPQPHPLVLSSRCDAAPATGPE